MGLLEASRVELRAWVVLIASACASCAANGETPACQNGAECASGACDRGVCVESSASGGAEVGGQGGAGDGGAGGDGAATTGGAGAVGGGAFCEPDFDGTVSRDEVVLMSGLTAKFLSTTDVTFSTTGTTEGTLRVWALDAALPGDHTTLVETRALGGAWYEDLYPGATYAAALSVDSDLLGIFEATDAALLLRGVVSPADGLTRTELIYDPPVVVLSFPVVEGASWSTSSTITGLAQGITVFYSESYVSTVDARGELRAPFGDFDALRVRTALTRTVGVLTTVIRSFAFVSECFGTIATLRSQDDEPNAEFVNVAEVRRLTP